MTVGHAARRDSCKIVSVGYDEKMPNCGWLCHAASGRDGPLKIVLSSAHEDGSSYLQLCSSVSEAVKGLTETAEWLKSLDVRKRDRVAVVNVGGGGQQVGAGCCDSRIVLGREMECGEQMASMGTRTLDE
nr:hypothetical protein CFP56_34771 [Quercus suber]